MKQDIGYGSGQPSPRSGQRPVASSSEHLNDLLVSQMTGNFSLSLFHGVT